MAWCLFCTSATSKQSSSAGARSCCFCWQQCLLGWAEKIWSNSTNLSHYLRFLILTNCGLQVMHTCMKWITRHRQEKTIRKHTARFHRIFEKESFKIAKWSSENDYFSWVFLVTKIYLFHLKCFEKALIIWKPKRARLHCMQWTDLLETFFGNKTEWCPFSVTNLQTSIPVYLIVGLSLIRIVVFDILGKKSWKCRECPNMSWSMSEKQNNFTVNMCLIWQGIWIRVPTTDMFLSTLVNREEMFRQGNKGGLSVSCKMLHPLLIFSWTPQAFVHS